MKSNVPFILIFISITLQEEFSDNFYGKSGIHIVKRNLPLCNEDQLVWYLAEIQAINPENIINLSTFEDLIVLCNKVSVSLDKVDGYLEKCEPPQQKDLYIQLIKGVDSLYQKLCVNEQFKKDFLQHFECYRDLHDNFEDCSGPPDWTEKDDSKVCKVYQDLVDCYCTKTAKLCGETAAKLMKELVIAVINSVLVVTCPSFKANPLVEDLMAESYKGNGLKAIVKCNLSTYIVFYTIILCIVF